MTGIRRVEDAPEHLLTAVRGRLSELRTEREALEERRREVDEQLERMRIELAHLEGLLAVHSGAPLDLPILMSAGEVAVSAADQVIAIIREAGCGLHYEEIERRMRARGLYNGGGANPANTLLAKYFNDPRLYRPSRGTYALREWQPHAASVGTKNSKRRGRKGA